MKEKHLHNIKNTGFKTPNNYFEELEESILIETKLKSIAKNTGFKTPKEYFGTFETSAIKGSKVIPLYKRKVITYISSIAAAALLIFSFIIFNKTNGIDSLDTASIDNYILEEVESSDIVSLFLENELTENQFIDYDFNDKAIDTFLENEDVNNLMIE